MTFLIICYVLSCILAVFGNIVCIAVFVVQKRGSSGEIHSYLINLAVCDILMAIFCVIFTQHSLLLSTFWYLSSLDTFHSSQLVIQMDFSGYVESLNSFEKSFRSFKRSDRFGWKRHFYESFDFFWKFCQIHSRWNVSICFVLPKHICFRIDYHKHLCRCTTATRNFQSYGSFIPQ